MFILTAQPFTPYPDTLLHDVMDAPIIPSNTMILLTLGVPTEETFTWWLYTKRIQKAGSHALADVLAIGCVCSIGFFMCDSKGRLQSRVWQESDWRGHHAADHRCQ